MRIEIMQSPKGGARSNQIIIHNSQGRHFRSYDTTIAFINLDGAVYLDKKYWNYSSTTTRYLSIFLGEDGKTTRKKIKSGEYKLKELN